LGYLRRPDPSPGVRPVLLAYARPGPGVGRSG
jgi:hypothetical protein